MVTHEMMETAVREHMREAASAQRQREARTARSRRQDARPRGGLSRLCQRRSVRSLLARLSLLASVS